MHAREDAAVARLRTGAAQVSELAQRPFDLRGGDAPVLERLLRGLRLQGALGIGEALLLLEDLLLELARRLGVMRVDQPLDLALPVAGRGHERGIHALGDLGAAAVGAVVVQAHEGGDVDVGTEGADVALVAGFYLGGVAHGASLHRGTREGMRSRHYRTLPRRSGEAGAGRYRVAGPTAGELGRAKGTSGVVRSSTRMDSSDCRCHSAISAAVGSR